MTNHQEKDTPIVVALRFSGEQKAKLLAEAARHEYATPSAIVRKLVDGFIDEL